MIKWVKKKKSEQYLRTAVS